MRMVQADGKHASWCGSMTESGRKPTDSWQDCDYPRALVTSVGEMDMGVLLVTCAFAH
jgi:hypothetical protein